MYTPTIQPGAPKGHRIVAQGDQPWVSRPTTPQAPQGRRRTTQRDRNADTRCGPRTPAHTTKTQINRTKPTPLANLPTCQNLPNFDIPASTEPIKQTQPNPWRALRYFAPLRETPFPMSNSWPIGPLARHLVQGRNHETRITKDESRPKEARLGRCRARSSKPLFVVLRQRWVRLPLASANPCRHPATITKP